MKLKNYIVPIIIFLAFVYRPPVNSFRLSYEVSLLYSCSLIFGMFLIYKKYTWPGWFLILASYASYLPVCSLLSMQSLRVIVCGVALYYAIVELNIKKENLFNGIAAVGLVHVLFLLLQYNNIDPYQIYGIKSNLALTGLTANPNEASALTALTLPCFFRRYWAYAIPLLVIGVLLSRSYGGILALAAILCVYCLYHGHKFTGLMTFGLILIGAYIFIDKPEFSARYTTWKAAILLYFNTEPFEIAPKIIIKKTFLTGFGLGHWKTISHNNFFDVVNDVYFHRAHNTFLHTWFEMGMGFLVILAFYAKRLYKQIKDNIIFILAVCAIFVTCNTNSTLRMNALNGLIIIVWIAIIECSWREQRIKI